MTAQILPFDPLQHHLDTLANPDATLDDLDQACTALAGSRRLYHQQVAAETRRAMGLSAAARMIADHADPVSADQVKATMQAMERNLDRATRIAVLASAAIAAVCWARGLL